MKIINEKYKRGIDEISNQWGLVVFSGKLRRDE